MKQLWDYISFLGQNTHSYSTKQKTYILSNRINFFIGVIGLFLLIALKIESEIVGHPFSFGHSRVSFFIGLSILNFILAYYKHNFLAKLSLSFLPCILFILFPTFIGFVEDESFFYYPYVIIALSLIPQLLLLPEKGKILYFGAILYYLALVFGIEKLLIHYSSNTLQIINLLNDFYFYNKLSQLVIFVFLHTTIFYLRRVNLIYENEFRKQNKRLDIQREELQSVIDSLKSTQQQLVQSEKMASLGVLTSGVAHEVNNPLNFINGGLFILEELSTQKNLEIAKENKQNLLEAVSIIKSGHESIAKVVNSLMSFSYRGEQKMVETDLREMINNTLLFLMPKIRDCVIVSKTYNLTKKVHIYPAKLHQVIINIMENAVYAAKLQIENPAKAVMISTNEVLLRGKSMAEIKIANTGNPIPIENLQRIFDPFFTTKGPDMGTGLGLSISYNIIKEHKGTIEASNVAGGVEVRILLPLQT